MLLEEKKGKRGIVEVGVANESLRKGSNFGKEEGSIYLKKKELTKQKFRYDSDWRKTISKRGSGA